MTSVDVERSFSQYKYLLNERRESLTQDNTKRLMLLYFNGDIEHCFNKLTLVQNFSLSPDYFGRD